ncbi:hypothetical protein [Baaleninema simplex]|uniref:hypothetical protein n=1 Tax=Baaleninema simplex TaxID=2862350 RepID=UPI00034DF392|nr:hypothetical protein [Baaleninema simplex]
MNSRSCDAIAFDRSLEVAAISLSVGFRSAPGVRVPLGGYARGARLFGLTML